jgi:thioredoxin 1
VRAALADKDQGVRWCAARTLGEIGDEASKDVLAKAMADDGDAEVRYYAAYSLASLGGEAALDYFRKQLTGDSVEERSRAVRALGKYGGKKCIGDVASALKDGDVRVRRTAVVQLDVARCTEAMPGLIAALGDEDHEVRKRARASLERVTGKDLGDDQAKWQEWWKESGKDFQPLERDRGPEPVKFANAAVIAGDEDFKKKVGEAKGLVAVDFHTAKGRDCSRFAPVFDKLAAEFKGKAGFYAAEAAANAAVIKKLGLRVPPTTVIFKDGEKVEIVAGFKEEDELRKIVSEHLAGTRKVPVQAPEQASVLEEKQLFPDLADAADFEKQVTGFKGVVLVDFHADWCIWCKRLKPILNKIHSESAERIRIVGVDTDKLAELKEKFGVTGLPTMIVFKDGKEAERISGFKEDAPLREIINRHLPEDGKLRGGDAPAGGTPGAGGEPAGAGEEDRKAE